MMSKGSAVKKAQSMAKKTHEGMRKMAGMKGSRMGMTDQEIRQHMNGGK